MPAALRGGIHVIALPDEHHLQTLDLAERRNVLLHYPRCDETPASRRTGGWGAEAVIDLDFRPRSGICLVG
jgi:hypothetical protein